MRPPAFRVGTALAFTGLILSFVLSLALGEHEPFTIVGALAVGGKWAESTVQRHSEGKCGEVPDA